MSAIKAGTLRVVNGEVTPAEFIVWAQGKGIPIPPELARMAPATDQTTPRRTHNKRKTEARNRAWQQGIDELATKHPGTSHAELCGKLAKEVGFTAQTIRRPAYGLVYATPSSAILKLVGLPAAVPLVEPPRALFPTTSLPTLGKGEYHVFVSYRSTDRTWAKDLVTRLEGVGFKVFIDEKELIPGDQLANTLQTALSRSNRQWS